MSPDYMTTRLNPLDPLAMECHLIIWLHGLTLAFIKGGSSILKKGVLDLHSKSTRVVTQMMHSPSKFRVSNTDILAILLHYVAAISSWKMMGGGGGHGPWPRISGSAIVYVPYYMTIHSIESGVININKRLLIPYLYISIRAFSNIKSFLMSHFMFWTYEGSP